MIKKILSILDVASGLICIAAGVLLALELGFELNIHNPNISNAFNQLTLNYFVCDLALRAILHPNRLKHLLGRFTDLPIIIPFLGHYFPELPLLSSLLITQIAIITVILGRFRHVSRLFNVLEFNPTQMLLVGFGFAIFTGSLLLSLPISTLNPSEFQFIDAVFTAASAVCVTGLVTQNVAETFSIFGQTVIMVLIQFGGLGIMAFSAILALFINKKITQKESSEFQKSYEAVDRTESFRIVKAIFKYTLLFECIGALLLLGAWRDKFDNGLLAVFYATFHSISAFCNAGFSLFQDSLMSFSGDPYTLLVISGLIIMGGLGFPVIMDLMRNPEKQGKRRLKLQSKLAITVSIFLLIFGTLCILLTEWSNGLSQFDTSGKILNAFFHSVSSRTAGFNSIDIGSLQPATLLVIISLMFIGANPGSTGGGVKTTTFAILVQTLISSLKSQPRTEAFGRSITTENSMRALSLITVSIIVIFTFLLFLLLSESTVFIMSLFETVSAFGTVGLSMGMTENLSNLGKGIIMIVMFIGRVGPLTVAFAFTRRKPKINYQYPEERILIT